MTWMRFDLRRALGQHRLITIYHNYPEPDEPETSQFHPTRYGNTYDGMDLLISQLLGGRY